jgi:hypothetical protein
LTADSTQAIADPMFELHVKVAACPIASFRFIEDWTQGLHARRIALKTTRHAQRNQRPGGQVIWPNLPLDKRKKGNVGRRWMKLLTGRRVLSSNIGG